MFRITEDPSSGSLVQYLTKNYKNDLIKCLIIIDARCNNKECHTGIQAQIIRYVMTLTYRNLL